MTEFEYQRRHIPLQPGETATYTSPFSGETWPVGFRLETDAELRARIKADLAKLEEKHEH
jgi:hypothetical protein